MTLPPISPRQSDTRSVVPYLTTNVLLQMSVLTRVSLFLPLEIQSIIKRTRHPEPVLGICIQLSSVLLKHSQRLDRPSADGLISLILTPLQPPLQLRSHCQLLANLIILPLPPKKPPGLLYDTHISRTQAAIGLTTSPFFIYFTNIFQGAAHRVKPTFMSHYFAICMRVPCPESFDPRILLVTFLR